MANEIKGITIEFKGDTIDLENSISKLNKTMSTLKSESKLLNKELKLDPSNAEKLNNVLKNLQNQQKVLTQELKIYNNELDQLEAGSKEWLDMSKKIDQVQNALDRVNTQIKQLDGYNLQQLSRQFEKLGTTLNNVGQKITQVGQALTPLSTAAAGALGFAVKSAIDLEDAFAGVEKTVDGSSAQLAALEQELRKMSTQAPVTAEEFAQIAENAGQLGIAIDDIAEFSEVMAGLGVATNLTSDEAATMIAQFANVVDIQGEYENFASALVKLGNEGASTEADIMELAQRLSGAGAVADMTAQEILGLAASMANVGINAEAGGTAMSTLISQMEKAAVQGGESLGALASVAGMTASEFAAAWNDEPAVAIDAFLAGLNEIQQSGGDVYGTLENLGITEKRLTDTVLRLASANGEVAKNVEMANEAWTENNALQNEVDRAYGTTASKLETLWNSIKELARQIGENLLPQINGLIDRAQDFIDSLLHFDDATKEMEKGVGGMVKALAPAEETFTGLTTSTKNMIIAITGITAVVAPLALIIGKIVTVFGGMFTAISNVLGVLGAAAGSGGLMGALGTITTTLTNLAAPITAAVALFAAMYATSENFRNAISSLAQSILNMFIPVLTGWWNALNNIWTTIQTYLLPVIQKLGDFIAAYLMPIIQGIIEFYNAYLAPIIQNLIELLGTNLSTAIAVVADWFSALIDVISILFQWATDLWNFLGDLGVWDAFVAILNVVRDVVNGVIDAVEWLVGVVRDAANAVAGFVSDVSNALGSIGGALGDFVSFVNPFDSGGFGDLAFNSGGFASGGINLSTNITVNTTQPITRSQVASWADIINEELGRRL